MRLLLASLTQANLLYSACFHDTPHRYHSSNWTVVGFEGEYLVYQLARQLNLAPEGFLGHSPWHAEPQIDRALDAAARTDFCDAGSSS